MPPVQALEPWRRELARVRLSDARPHGLVRDHHRAEKQERVDDAVDVFGIDLRGDTDLVHHRSPARGLDDLLLIGRESHFVEIEKESGAIPRYFSLANSTACSAVSCVSTFMIPVTRSCGTLMRSTESPERRSNEISTIHPSS